MNDIAALLEKYYNGETSLDEERRIRAYFATHPEAERNADAQLSNAVQAIRTAQSATPAAKPRGKALRYITACGAALAAGLVLVLTLRQPPALPQQPVKATESSALVRAILVNPEVSGELHDEQQALEQARKALAFVSSKLNKGITGVRHFNKLEQSISKIQNKEKS